LSIDPANRVSVAYGVNRLESIIAQKYCSSKESEKTIENVEFMSFNIRIRNLYLPLQGWIEYYGRFMCLLKVYLEKGGSRRLIAENVALAVREGSGVRLRSLELMDVVSLEDVDISLIDTFNSVMILKPKTEETIS
jgi:hypothetical protein